MLISLWSQRKGVRCGAGNSGQGLGCTIMHELLLPHLILLSQVLTSCSARVTGPMRGQPSCWNCGAQIKQLSKQSQGTHDTFQARLDF